MERNIVHPEVESYLETLLPQAEPVRAHMERIAEERDFPIVGPLVGRLLFVLARGIGARRVFELGSGFGYSAFWFAQAVGPQGRVFCTDRSDKHAAEAKDLLARAGLAARVEFHTGDALEVFAEQPGPFDIVFCDIDKEGYPEVPRAAIPKLRP
ncbi:MAG: class I SAM-dependent methyltransferase, partial [Deltaproteobacteria bacterium]|nr:class I SAM-dependent methyltransferase [Deltaproteobacteria bacterium]